MNLIKALAGAACLATSFVVATAGNAQDAKHYRFAHDQQLNSGYSLAYDLFAAKLKELSKRQDASLINIQALNSARNRKFYSW